MLGIKRDLAVRIVDEVSVRWTVLKYGSPRSPGVTRLTLPVEVRVHHAARVTTFDGDVDRSERLHHVSHHRVIDMGIILYVETEDIPHLLLECGGSGRLIVAVIEVTLVQRVYL